MIYKILFYINLIVIEYLATTTHQIDVIATIWDKAKHSFAFFVLYILLTLAYKKLSTLQKIIFLLIFGIQIEAIQYFIPNREASLLDLFADIIGLILGVLLFKIFNS